MIPKLCVVLVAFVHGWDANTHPCQCCALFGTVVACCICLALGSYVAVVLIPEALLEVTLSLVSLTPKHLVPPGQAFVDDLVRMLRHSVLDDNE